MNTKLKEIIDLFYNEYTQEYVEQEQDFNKFRPFRKKLLERGIVEEACGLDHCDICPILMEEETVEVVTRELKIIINKKLD